MSIVFPPANISALGGANGAGGAVGLLLPASASFKAANVGMVTGMFYRGPQGGDQYLLAQNHSLISRGAGSTGGNDAFIRNTDQTGTGLTCNFRSAGTVFANLALTGLTASKTYLVMLIVTAGYVHFVACEPGGSPIVQSTASSTFYALNLAASDCWTQIGAGTSTGTRGTYLPIENYFMLTGLFPESGGIPDATLIQNIANGTQSIATLDAQLTSGSKRWHYPLNIAGAYSDAYGIASALTTNNVTTDKVIMTGGPLRPTILTPTPVMPSVSQVIFGTPGDSSTAFADIISEGGTYTGSPSAIQTRLRKEDGTDLVGWTVCDASPSGGTFDSYTFQDVPMTAGNLNHEFRQVDGGGTQIGDIVGSYGTKGSGFHFIQQSQSQGVGLWNNASYTVTPPATGRARMTRVQTTSPLVFRSFQVDPAQGNSIMGTGIKQAAIECNTLYPGVPCHFVTLGVDATPITDFLTGGAYEGNWAGLATRMGVVQPYVLFHMGHSTGPDASYETHLGSLRAMAVAALGTPLATLHAPTPRYAGAGTGGNYTAVEAARNGIRNRVANNPTTDYIAGNWQNIKNDTNDTGPHAMQANRGAGRSGAQVAWGLMMWCRAVEDKPLRLTATRTSTTTINLSFVSANP